MLNSDTNQGYSHTNIDGFVTGRLDYITGISLAANVTLTEDQAKAGILEVSTGHASNAIIIPTGYAKPGKLYIVVNGHATLAANIKVAGGTAVVVAATKTAIVRINSAGSEIIRVTTDA
jgi:hypothetical protein